MDKIYSDEYKNGGKGEVIEEVLYKGYKFVIKSSSTHPRAYVGGKKPPLSRDELGKILEDIKKAIDQHGELEND